MSDAPQHMSPPNGSIHAASLAPVTDQKATAAARIPAEDEWDERTMAVAGHRARTVCIHLRDGTGESPGVRRTLNRSGRGRSPVVLRPDRGGGPVCDRLRWPQAGPRLRRDRVVEARPASWGHIRVSAERRLCVPELENTLANFQVSVRPRGTERPDIAMCGWVRQRIRFGARDR